MATPVKHWIAPPIWKNQTVFVIGGGPSIINFDIIRLQPHNCIAINNAFIIAPWSRFLVFHDSRWLKWHLDGVQKFTGTRVTTNSKAPPIAAKRMQKDRRVAINCTDPTVLAGIDSGTMGLNLAFHFGASTIALVGFDMGFTARSGKVIKHWHTEHPISPHASNYDRFLKQYPDIQKALLSNNVKLVSLTPTRIDIPKVQLSAII